MRSEWSSRIFFNPGHLVPLVEIVQHDETKPEIVKTTMDLMRKIGKSPILLKKENSRIHC
ncbi:3-hydroxyacyl-CoA dehydrogenase NAD-binding domain-containing protein [Peribacillus frigoritolerans]|nr:3-hydroxyacyl-CoA dehydrogenase NAD-binding domain-containing protein [Peribacillus frigoritolerans]